MFATTVKNIGTCKGTLHDLEVSWTHFQAFHLLHVSRPAGHSDLSLKNHVNRPILTARVSADMYITTLVRSMVDRAIKRSSDRDIERAIERSCDRAVGRAGDDRSSDRAIVDTPMLELQMVCLTCGLVQIAGKSSMLANRQCSRPDGLYEFTYASSIHNS